MPVVRVSWFQSIETTAKKAFAKEITESMVRNFNFRRRNIQKSLRDFCVFRWALLWFIVQNHATDTLVQLIKAHIAFAVGVRTTCSAV